MFPEAQNLIWKKNVRLVYTSDSVVVVGVTEKVPESLLDPGDVIPKKVMNWDTDVIAVGEIRALDDDVSPRAEEPPTRFDKWRPAPGGVSCGHIAITAGTLGMKVVAEGNECILSNNHVLANSNLGHYGDQIVQPGIYDRGQPDIDRIGTLWKWVPIQWIQDGDGCPIARAYVRMGNVLARILGSKTRLLPPVRPRQEQPENLVDAALAFGDPNTLRDDILEVGVPKQFGEAQLGDQVIKSGRTSAVTTGPVAAIDGVVNVSYPGFGTALYVDQIIVSGKFMSPGDSGSVVLLADKETVVGLGFAGSDQIGIVNKISHVRQLLGGFEIP